MAATAEFAAEAWERTARLLQDVVQEISDKFDALTVVCRTHWSSDTLQVSSAEAIRGKDVQADICSICEVGDCKLLEELCLDLFEESLKRRIIPRFWQFMQMTGIEEDMSFDSAFTNATVKGIHFCPSWCATLQVGMLALGKIHAAFHTLVLDLQTPGAKEMAQSFCTSFRIAFSESLPTKFVQHLHNYFQWMWQQSLDDKDSQRNERTDEEWWWAPMATEPTASWLGGRVIALLNPARKPGCVSGSPGLGAASADVPMIDAADVVQHETWLAEGSYDESMFSPSTIEEEISGEHQFEADSRDLTSISSPNAAPMQSLREMADALHGMGLGNFWRDLVMRFVIEELATTIEHRCRSAYDSRGLLDRLTAWLYRPLLRWLRAAHGLPDTAPRRLETSDDGAAMLEAEAAWWGAARRVVLQFFETFVEVRIREAFDMVRDFPESTPALLDLRRCLARTGRTAPLVRALRRQLSRRLLIAGAHTRDVIKVYIKTIKAMRLVDPRGLLLEAVSQPIRAYLKRRKDTIRCIITALTEDSDLQLELHLGAEAGRVKAPGAVTAATAAGATAAGSVQAGDRSGADGARIADRAGSFAANQIEPPDFAFGAFAYEISDDEEDPDSWTPDPMDADPLVPSGQRRAQDVVSLLVGIYGSKEMFIKEYKEMLADRLLGNPSYSTEKEMQNLELLKTRFGEAALSHCEVMLQDIKDSKRINVNVQQHAKSQHSAVSVPSGLVSFRPQRSDVSGPGNGSMSRHFMAPLSSMFGLCLSPTGGGGASSGSAGSAGVPISLANALQVSGSDGPRVVPAAEESRQLSLDQMHALVLSQHYWPSALAKADHPHFKLPPDLENALADYGMVYAQTRARRNLNWKRAHGLVEITVQLADRELPVTVSPVHVAVLACFVGGGGQLSEADCSDTKESIATRGSSPPSPQLSLSEVAQQLELPESLVRKRISFWVAKGVLREIRAGVFDVQESLSTPEGMGGGNHLDEDVEHSPGQSGGRPGTGGGTDELKVCEAFIQVVLTNSPSLPLGRIHNSLQMFMTDPQYTQTEVQLRDFLTQLCQEGKLEFDGSNYSLAKKA